MNQKGFGLLETMISLGILSVGMLSVLNTVVDTSVIQSKFSKKNSFDAIQFAMTTRLSSKALCTQDFQNIPVNVGVLSPQIQNLNLRRLPNQTVLMDNVIVSNLNIEVLGLYGGSTDIYAGFLVLQVAQNLPGNNNQSNLNFAPKRINFAFKTQGGVISECVASGGNFAGDILAGVTEINNNTTNNNQISLSGSCSGGTFMIGINNGVPVCGAPPTISPSIPVASTSSPTNTSSPSTTSPTTTATGSGSWGGESPTGTTVASNNQSTTISGGTVNYNGGTVDQSNTMTNVGNGSTGGVYGQNSGNNSTVQQSSNTNISYGGTSSGGTVASSTQSGSVSGGTVNYNGGSVNQSNTMTNVGNGSTGGVYGQNSGNNSGVQQSSNTNITYR